MGVVKYPHNTQITPHFNSDEFKCPHCGVTRISKELVDKLELLMKKVNVLSHRDIVAHIMINSKMVLLVNIVKD